MVWAYIDGACLDKGKPWARAGYGVMESGLATIINCCGQFSGSQTNQVAEVQSAITALEIAEKEDFESLVLHTDSKYLIKGAAKWIQNGGKRQLDEL